MQFLMEDVLQNHDDSAVDDHADCQASLANSKQVPLAIQFIWRHAPSVQASL